MDCTALSSYNEGIQDGLIACPSIHVLTKSTSNLHHHISIIIRTKSRPSHFNSNYIRMDCTALDRYSEVIQDGLIACRPICVLIKSTKNLGHLI